MNLACVVCNVGGLWRDLNPNQLTMQQSTHPIGG